MIPWTIIIITILVLILVIVAVTINKDKKNKTDYYSLFTMGTIWLPFGIVMSLTNDTSIGNIFIILGLIYMAIGLSHKSSWKKNHIPINKLPKKQKYKKIALLTILIIILTAGAISPLII